MSLSTDITTLVTQAQELVDTFNNKEAEIDAAMQAAIDACPSQFKTFYVDPVDGDDDADGSEDAPFLTLEQAVNETPVAGGSKVYLLGDVTLAPKRSSLSLKQVQVLGNKAANGQAKISLTVFEEDFDGNTYALLSGWNTFGLNSGFMFRYVKLQFPQYTGTAISWQRYRSILGNYSGYEQTLSHFGISTAELIMPETNGFGYLACAKHTGLVFLANCITDTNGNMSGYYVDGVDPDDPGATPNMLTNMTSM